MLNQIVNDDCLNWFKTIESGTVDCIVTDPPYKIKAGGVTVKHDVVKTNLMGGIMAKQRNIISTSKIGDKWVRVDGVIPSAAKDGKMFECNDISFKEWMPELYRVLKTGTHCYVMTNASNLHEMQSEAMQAGFVFQNLLVWDKGNATPNKYYMQGAEFILMLSKRPARNINNMGSSTILRYNNIIGNKIHPTEKPIDLLTHLICNSTKESDIVLDPFAGSGSTAIACLTNNRQFLTCEKDVKFFNIANDRITNFTKYYSYSNNNQDCLF